MNIRLVNETTVGSSVNVVNVTDVFTSDFEIYKIVIPQMNTEGVSATDVGMRFINTSGTRIYSSDYDYGNSLCKQNVSIPYKKLYQIDYKKNDGKLFFL